MKKILYVGIFSTSNIGDLVISNQIYNYLKNKADVSVDCMDFITFKRIECINRDFLQYTDYNANIKNIKNILSSSKIIKRIYHTCLELYLLSNRKIFREYEKSVNKYTVICVGGGNLLMSVSNNLWAIKINELIKVAKKNNKKVFIISVGAGPILLDKSQKLFKEALNMADYVTVRDEYSRDVLKNELKIGKEVYISGDPALLLNSENTIKNRGNRDDMNIAISVMPFGKRNFLNLPYYKNYKYYLNMYKNIVEYFYSKNNNYMFHLFSTEMSDYATILELQAYILKKTKCITKRNLKVEYITSLSDLLKFYKRQNLLIGTRMHSLIIGFTQSLPIIAISWQNKVAGFMKHINLMQYCYQLNMINENIDKIYDDAQQLLTHNQEQNCKNKLIDLRRRFNYINSYIETLVD
ncbi:hypothetical protein C4E24_06485 [ANME-1 cluster archaeon AG-394-G21]|nr:hypothetical protein [ANME-1 cluster archaeon AG-394-G21]